MVNNFCTLIIKSRSRCAWRLHLATSHLLITTLVNARKHLFFKALSLQMLIWSLKKSELRPLTANVPVSVKTVHSSQDIKPTISRVSYRCARMRFTREIKRVVESGGSCKYHLSTTFISAGRIIWLQSFSRLRANYGLSSSNKRSRTRQHCSSWNDNVTITVDGIIRVIFSLLTKLVQRKGKGIISQWHLY